MMAASGNPQKCDIMLPPHLVAHIVSFIKPDIPTPNPFKSNNLFLSSLMSVNKAWYNGYIMHLYETLHFTSEEQLHFITSRLLSDVHLGLNTRAKTLNPLGTCVKSINIQTRGDGNDELMIGDIQVLISLTPNLQELIIRNSMLVSNIVVRGVSEHALRLRYLDFRGCLCISDIVVPVLIEKLTSLEHLDVSYTSVTPSAVTLLLPIAHRLRALIMDGCTYISASSTPTLPLTNISNQPKRAILEKFSAIDSELNDDYARYIANTCPSLMEVTLSSCHVSDETVLSISRNCPLLDTLDVSFLCSVTDVGMYALAAFANKLKILAVAGCDNITPLGVYALCSKCEHLKELVLNDCPAVLNSYIADHSTAKSTSLECILMNEDVKAVARHHNSSNSSGSSCGDNLIWKNAQTTSLKAIQLDQKKEDNLQTLDRNKKELNIFNNKVTSETAKARFKDGLLKSPSDHVSEQLIPSQAESTALSIATPPTTPRLKHLLELDEANDIVNGPNPLIPISDSDNNQPKNLQSLLPQPSAALNRLSSNGRNSCASSHTSPSRSSIPRASPEPSCNLNFGRPLNSSIPQKRDSFSNNHGVNIWNLSPKAESNESSTNVYKPKAGRMKMNGSNDFVKDISTSRIHKSSSDKRNEKEDDLIKNDKKKLVTVTASTAGYHVSPGRLLLSKNGRVR